MDDQFNIRGETQQDKFSGGGKKEMCFVSVLTAYSSKFTTEALKNWWIFEGKILFWDNLQCHIIGGDNGGFLTRAKKLG